jgi:hypothetical protein
MRLVVTLVACVALASACDATHPATTTPPPDDTPQIFLATDESFANFQQWQSYTLTDPPAIDSGSHSLGTRLIYINQLPPHGSSAFPIGTIIVKIIQDQLTAHGPTTFAMVKRGGNYNNAGASGWEWYQLNIGDPLAGLVLWKGTDSPSGTYNGLTQTGCNECHALAKGNDYVQSPVLDLSKL